MLIYFTHTSHFSAAHKIQLDRLTLEENYARFGKCANPNWHGHNYTLYVTLKGTPQPEGYLIPKKVLDDLIQNEVIAYFEGKNLNVEVTCMNTLMPSTEHIAVQIWNLLQPHLQPWSCQIHKIELWETKNNFVEYYGH